MTVSLHPLLVEALSSGAQILTPGQRAVHVLRRASPQPDPACSTLNAWLDSLWTSLTLTGQARRMLLNRTQEAVLWRQSILEDPEVSALHSVDALADLASSAYSTLTLFGGRALLAQYAQSTDSKAFLRWIDLFEQLLRKHVACVPAQLPELLLPILAAGDLPIHERGVLLVDFDTLAPAHARLFAEIERAGYPVRSLTTANPEPAPAFLAAEDAPDEMHQAARWLRSQLKLNPESRLALVVPGLGQVRPQLERVLTSVVAPECAGLGGDPSSLPFEFSLGTPLGQTSAISTACSLLRLASSPQPIAIHSALLLSPTFGAAGSLDEQLAAAEFDAYELRAARSLRPQRSLESLSRLAVRSPRADRISGLISRLRALTDAASEQNLNAPDIHQTHARWADSFRAVLAAASWSAAMQRSSSGFQLQRRWESSLDELSTLDFDGSRTSAQDALDALVRIAGGIVFAPETHNAPVQVLGPLELGGISFDALWFLGAGDLSWPASPSLNPLLPRPLALLLGLPGASLTEAHELGRALTKRIAGSAPDVVISYAKLAEGQHVRPSPAIAGLTLSPLEAEPEKAIAETLSMDQVPDLPTTQPLPDAVIRGGAGILEQQAACAFRAFAQHRLGSTELARQSDGFDPGERGSLVHIVMQYFWQDLTDQGALKQLSPAERESWLDQCIGRALSDANRAAETPWDRAYLRAQHIRLHNLLVPWIDQELLRPPFAVRVSEQELDDVALGPLRLRLRVDRIDETEAGDLILDYKTGFADPKEWRSDRPGQPQLPLYAVLAPEPVAGIAFAQLRPGKGLALRGFAESADLFGGKPGQMDTSTFAEQLERWQQVLTALAHDFHRGHAQVDPKEFPKTCQFCAHRILCRVDTALLGEDDDEDSIEDETDRVHG